MNKTTKLEAKKAGLEGMLTLIKSAPSLIVFLLLVAGFLWYIDRHTGDGRMDQETMEKLAQIRIDTCHAVQEQSTNAIEDHTKATLQQAIEIRELIFILKMHVDKHGCVMPEDHNHD